VLLAGKPILQLPFNVEQFHTARNTERLGAGAMALLDNAAEITRAFDRVVNSSEMRESAEKFARQHRRFDPASALNEMVARIESMAVNARTD